MLSNNRAAWAKPAGQRDAERHRPYLRLDQRTLTRWRQAVVAYARPAVPPAQMPVAPMVWPVLLREEGG